MIILYSNKAYRRKLKQQLREWLKENPIDNKCAVIYGNLPPETKKSQALAFNNQDEGFKFLVATDAIGMGLNLNINRIIFTTNKKFNKTGKQALLSPSQVLQIAGRAGRYHNDGFVTAFTDSTLRYVREWIEQNKKHPKIKQKVQNKEPPKAEVEINIDQYQNLEESEDEEYFVTHTKVEDEDELEESKYDFENEEDDNDQPQLIDKHKFEKAQMNIK